MRILVTGHTYITDLTRGKLRALAALEPGIDVTVVVPRVYRPGGVQSGTIESEPRDEGAFRLVPISNFGKSRQGLYVFGPELIGLLRRFRPHVIQVDQSAWALSYAQLITLNRALGLGARNLFFTWWNLPYSLRFSVSLLEAYNLRGTDGIISGNREGADILRARGYTGPVTVIPQLGVDEVLFQPRPEPRLAAELGIAPGEFVVGFVGRFVPEKGIQTLFKALGRLRDRNWKCLLIGRGPLRDELMQRAAEHGFRDRLVLVDSVPHTEVPRYINLMSALVLPSETTHANQGIAVGGWKEQFGHVLIEAMACRVPVVGSDSGEIPHVIGDAGLVFPEGDADALRERLASLIDRPELARRLAELGYARAMDRYTNRVTARQQLDFYREVLLNGRSSRARRRQIRLRNDALPSGAGLRETAPVASA